MLDRDLVTKKMEERGFWVHSIINRTKIQFLTAPGNDPVISIIIDLEKEEFRCAYSVPHSINTLNAPPCSSVMNDAHFDKIVGQLEAQAKVLSRFS